MTSPTSSSSSTPGGYREVFAISFPLILSTSSFSLMHLVDRIFLSWYSPEAIAASVPAGAAAWTVLCLFMGTAGYVSTFVSQYEGAGRPERIGISTWQGVFFSLVAALALVLIAGIGKPLFEFAGHPEAVRRDEVVYFEILVLGGGGVVVSAALSGFYSGRGKTWVVMWVNLLGALVNGVLDWVMIFGKWGFPEWGIYGAGLATIIAPWTMTAIYLALFLLPENRRRFKTLESARFDPELFRRLLRFGFPSGLQFMVDVSAFTVFVLLIGRIGVEELAASNIAFAINHLLFMPMIGLSMGTSVLVGRYLGADKPDLSARAVSSAYRMTVAYMALFSIALVCFPTAFLEVFRPKDLEADFQAVIELGTHLLYFVAAYSTIDASNIVFISALKGAGDTRFVLWIMVFFAVTVLVGPSYVACVLLGKGIYTAWAILTLYVVVLAVAYWLRYRAGHWRSMRVIEHAPAPGATVSEGPVVET
ncbi:MAG: Multidrug resistance protein NorM [bacterium]|nr:Multidrug resistance protein NorM [bacterium]